jgi:NAD(P)-dependent dehydrogenase (short-subunit alcohol dehydrogenase family)
MNFPDFSLNGQVALVTGGRRGIGQAIALTFANAGADVAVCDVVTEDGALESTGDEIRKLGRRALTIKADTSREADINHLVEQVVAQWGTIDILVNNAGINMSGPFLEMSGETWDKVMNVNLKGYFLMAKAVGRVMFSKKKGCIINMSSRFAFRPSAHSASYSISKAGVAMLTKVIAKELGGYGIRANAIAPGMIKTDFNRRAWENETNLAKFIASTPLGRIGEVSDIAGAALYLASPASSYVSGHVLLVDGGNDC